MRPKSKPQAKPSSWLAPFVSLFFIGAVLSAAQTTSSASDPDIVTDRPDITESSIVVPRGSLQVENGLTWTNDHGTTMLDATETLIRLGISTGAELRIVAPNYLGGSSKNDMPGTPLKLTALGTQHVTRFSPSGQALS
jgi:hypothetical protein